MNLQIFLKFFPVIATVIYFLGFFIWNFYLSLLGFAQYDLFQLRYVLTGIMYISLVMIFPYTISIFLYLINLMFNKSEGNSIDDTFLRFIKTPLFSFFVGLSLIFMIIYAFPLIPDNLGGAKPRAVALIADSEYIDFINEFGFKSPYKKQTVIHCLLYENNDVVILMLEDRLIELEKSKLLGKVSLPSFEVNDMRGDCAQHVATYLKSARMIIPEVF